MGISRVVNTQGSSHASDIGLTGQEAAMFCESADALGADIDRLKSLSGIGTSQGIPLGALKNEPVALQQFQ